MARKKGITISKVRGTMYTTAKFLGDVQAISSGSPKKMFKRFLRRIVGKYAARFISALFN